MAVAICRRPGGRLLNDQPLRYGIAYAVTYTVLNAVELTMLFNPVADIATYVLTEIALVALVIGGFNQLFWKTRRPAAPAAP